MRNVRVMATHVTVSQLLCVPPSDVTDGYKDYNYTAVTTKRSVSAQILSTIRHASHGSSAQLVALCVRRASERIPRCGRLGGASVAVVR